MKIENNSVLLFIGDSITDTGRDRPVGEGDGLGAGYVSIVDGLLTDRKSYIEARGLATRI